MRWIRRLVLPLAALVAAFLVVPRVWVRLFPGGGARPGPLDGPALAARMDRTTEAVADALADLGVPPAALTEGLSAEVEVEGVCFRPRWIEADAPAEVDRAAVLVSFQRATAPLPGPSRVYVTAPDPLTVAVRVESGKFATHRVTLHPALPEDPPVDPDHPPVVALVLMGVGEPLPEVDETGEWRLPVTLAIEPWRTGSVHYAEMASRSSKEVLVDLRQATPAVGGPGADPFQAVPYAAGVLLRARSDWLARAEVRTPLVQALVAGRLPALLGPGESAAPDASALRASGVRIREIGVVLDATEGDAARRSAVVRARNLAVRGGAVVLAVEARADDIRLAREVGVALRERGYRFAFASEVGPRPAGPAAGEP